MPNKEALQKGVCGSRAEVHNPQHGSLGSAFVNNMMKMQRVVKPRTLWLPKIAAFMGWSLWVVGVGDVQSLQHRHIQSLHRLINHKILSSINFPTLLTSLKSTAPDRPDLHSLHLARLLSVTSSVELSTMRNTNKGLNPAKKKDFVCLGVGRICNLPGKKMNRLKNLWSFNLFFFFLFLTYEILYE